MTTLDRVERLRSILAGFRRLGGYLRAHPGTRLSLGRDGKRHLVELGREQEYVSGTVANFTRALRETTRSRPKITTRAERTRNAVNRVHVAKAKALRAKSATSPPSIPPSVLPGRPGTIARVGLMTAKG